MALSSDRWKIITPSNYTWEQEALQYIRDRLPDSELYHAWTNFEFISDDGSINEVDLLIFTPCGFFIIEIKSKPGTLTGDTMTWNWGKGRKSSIIDNPLFLTNRKAKKLASILRRQKALQKMKLPFLRPLVFCSALELEFQLSGLAGYHICLPDESKYAAGRGIMNALKTGIYPGSPPHASSVVDRPMARAITQAMEQVGIRPSQRTRRVGVYNLGELLYQSPTDSYQDWAATHSSIESIVRRVRIYNIAPKSSERDREFTHRAARREFQILEEIKHQGILEIHDFFEHDLGYALIFHHYPDALRLDHFLAQRADSLTIDVKLNLLRQIAETLQYAHQKRLIHRSLSPQSILVTEADSDSPKIKIFNWQVGFRRSSGGSTRDIPRLTPTSHLDQFIEDAAMAYLAPEAVSDPELGGEQLDIFSLGAIAYHLFSGRPPATNGLELREKIREGSGLCISEVMDGVVEPLQELIQLSTYPESSVRWETVAEFLSQLDDVEEKLTRPDPDYIPNPLDAKVNDRLEGGFIVKGRLGKGSSATAFVVEKAGREVVLKLANDIEHNDAIQAEAATLRKLRHPGIIEVYQDVMISNLAGFTMQKVEVDSQKKEKKEKEVETLTQWLRREGLLSIDFLQHFGEDLLDAVNYLERKGVPHRDIKPDNIVVGQTGAGSRLSLTLFDFSLSDAPFDRLRLGTPRYIDPFLDDRKRWDLYAERYAAAVTLYQMATSAFPVWGDGMSDPSLSPDCEVTLNDTLFDPSLRDGLTEFFRKCFRRDARKRYDNAEEMLRAWRRIFDSIDQPISTTTEDEADFETWMATAPLVLITEIGALPLTARAVNALERINVMTIKDLLSISQWRLSRMQGVGIRTRREIVKIVNLLRPRFPEVAPAAPSAPDPVSESDDGRLIVIGIDLLSQQIVNLGQQEKREDERVILHAFLGLDSSGNFTAAALEWPSQAKIAREMGLDRTRIAEAIAVARERWRRNPSITRLRDAIVTIIDGHGGSMTLLELCEATLNARGCVASEPRRSRLAAAVIRAAVAVERDADSPRFNERRLENGRILITQFVDVAGYVDQIGRVADELARLDPIATPARALERLREISTPDSIAPLADVRLVKLATAASSEAALSSRLEIYPVGLAAVTALRLSLGALIGVGDLTVEMIQERVKGRYPKAEPIPHRPELDDLLAEAGIAMTWDAGKRVYQWDQAAQIEPSSSTASRGALISPASFSASGSDTIELRPEIADARILDHKLRRAAAEGSFLALTVAPERLLDAENALLDRFDLERHNLDQLFLQVMREQAAHYRVDWGVALRADAAPHDSRDWRNLMIFVSRCVPIIEERLSRSEKTLLLVYPGLLSRYGRIDVLERLRERITTPGGGLHGVWTLIASDDQMLPKLDQVPVPVISSNQWARLTKEWIEGGHQNNHLKQRS
jgi:serine/threonine protein kinase